MGRTLKSALSEAYHKRYDERRKFARSFKWSDSAELVCAEIEAKSYAELSAPQVAWVTSVDKIARGTYDLDLLRTLGERCNLVLAVDHLESVPSELATHVRTVSWSEMLTLPTKFDQIIYDGSDLHLLEELKWVIAQRTGLMILDDPATLALNMHSSDVRQLLHMISGLIVPSTESANRLRDTLNVPITVIPMAFVDPLPTTMAHHRLKLGKSLGRTLVGTQITCDDVEFFGKLCTAVMQLPERFRSHFELVVLDYASAEASFRMHILAQKAGVVHCHFLPKMESAIAHEYIAACDVWVPSNNGPASRMAMLRAMALGTPCLAPGATSSDNPNSVVRQMRAIPWQLDELAATLKLHAEQPHLRKIIAKAGLTHIQQRHGMKQCANAWCDLIDRAVKRRIEADHPWQEAAVQALAQLPAEYDYDDLEAWAELHLEAQRLHAARIPQMRKAPTPRPIERQPMHLPPRPLHSMMSTPRRIWIDVSYIATVHNGRFTGICRTVVSVLREMIARPELPLNFCVYQEFPTPHFRPIDRDQIENLLSNGSWVNGGENIRGVTDEQEVEFWEDDVLFLPELNVTPPYCQLLRDLKATLDLRIVPVVYDIICCREPQLFGPHGIPHFWNWAVCLLETAEVILSISEYTKKDLQWLAEVNQLPEPNIEVFRLGDSDLYQTAGGASSIGGLTRDDPFVLMVSTIEVRKNHQLTYHTWRRLIEKHGVENVPKLVYVGSPGWLTENFGDLIRSDPTIRDHILWMSNLGDDGLGWLYRNCLFTLYPSHYEGWGLPIGESLSFGKYCIASMSSSIPEIGGPLVDYHDPNDLPAFEQLVERAIFDEEYRKARERLIRMEYQPTTWSACAAEIVDIWQTHLGYFDPFTEVPWPQMDDAKRWAS